MNPDYHNRTVPKYPPNFYEIPRKLNSMKKVKAGENPSANASGLHRTKTLKHPE
jgi:hypothetical protein